jgi:hypothetical protein
LDVIEVITKELVMESLSKKTEGTLSE